MARGPEKVSEQWADLRAAIDAVDDELLGLLNRRAALAAEVAARKQAAGAPFYVPGRERAIVDRLQAANPGPFPTAAIRPVFQEVISACLSVEKPVRVAYLGPEATFTHQAVKRHFGTSSLALGCGSIDAVFAEVERGAAEFGVVPVENSTEGVVNHTLDCFIDRKLVIAAEIEVPIEHCLLAQGGVQERDVLRVYSHPQALAQCRTWLKRNLPAAQLVDAASTADAARSALADGQGAALASELAAKLYGLTVLREKVQDAADNTTRFLAVSRAGESPARVPAADYKTSVVLALGDQPGALEGVLSPLASRGINLTKIESRPSKRRAWDYFFFLDLDGHRDDPEIAAALQEVGDACRMFGVLGSYRKADKL